MKTLIVYGTRYGATESTTQEIANILKEEGFDVHVVNAKKEKVKDISQYQLVIVGSGMQMFRWTGEAEDFLEKFQQELSKKKLAMFVSSAVKSTYEREGKNEELGKLWKPYLEDKAAKYNLHPIAMAIFGGIIDYNKMNPITRRAFSAQKKVYEADRFKENPPGVYDMRDLEEIRKWAKGLAEKARV